MRRPAIPFAAAVLLIAAAAGALSAQTPSVWPPARQREVLDKTLTIELAPDLAGLTSGERAAVAELLEVGAIFQRLYEDGLHHQALAAKERLAPAETDLRALYRLFNGPIATTLDNRREPFLAVDPPVPGRSFYPWGITKDEVRAYLDRNPERTGEILGERTVVRRADRDSLERDLGTLRRHPVLDALHPGLADRLGDLRALLAAPPPAAGSTPSLYAVPYAVAWGDWLVEAQRRLFRAADAVDGDDPQFARYLRNRGRDLLANDYESGDASWVTGQFGNLNAQIGAYETYDDALFGVKAGHSFSLLVRDQAASAELARNLGGLQAIEDALPTAGHKRVREQIPVGVYSVIADFGQARGTNTATILPNDPLFTARYGRTILLRGNIMKHPEIVKTALRRWTAAVAPPFAADLTPDGPFQRTLWHEVGHYLGVDRTRDGRALNQALEDWADALEEMKADLVSLFTIHRFHRDGRIDAALLRSVQAAGILRTLQQNQPRREQAYQTMQLAQFNYFLDRGLLEMGADGRLVVRHEKYADTVSALLGEVLELQSAGDPAKAGAFFTRWTGWREDLHAPLAARLRAAAGPQFTLVRYAAID